MLRRQLTTVIVLLGALSSTKYVIGSSENYMNIKYPKGTIGPEMHTNIALVGAQDPETTMQQYQPNVLIDPSKLYNQVSEEFRNSDIEEDPQDRFVTTRTGKPRVHLVEEAEDWAGESPLIPNSVGRVLVRKKRCGGGGGDDDDGNANRARRARRARARRTQRNRVRRQRRAQRKAARRAARTRTTTITRTILPANQLATYQGQAGAQVYVQQQQPGVIQTIQTQPSTVQTFETIQKPGHVQVITQPQFQVQSQAVAGMQPLAMGGAVSAVANAAAA